MRPAPPSPPFDARTTNQVEYGVKPLPARAPAPEQPRWEQSARFQGQSEAHDQFRQWEMPRPDIVPMAPAPPPAPFDAVTTNQVEYTAKPLPAREQAVPQQWEPSPAKFNGQTTYGDDFTQKPIPREEPVPMRPAPPSPPFDAKTTNQVEYTQKQLPVREAAMPQEWQPSPAKFNASTEYGSNFQGWKLPASKPGLGIAMVDGSFYPLIPSGWEAPVRASVVITSVVDGQTTTCIQVLQGSSVTASQDNLVGSFKLNVPPGPVGAVQVEVVFHIDESYTLHVAARDRQTGEHAEIIVGSEAVSPIRQ